MNKPRDKGTMAESAVVAFLRGHGFPYAERRSLKGSLDQGDVTGTPGLCWEVKYANGGLRLASWMRELALEILNSGAEHGILVVKPISLGVMSVNRWYAVMRLPEHEALIKQAGMQGEFFLPPAIGFTAGNLAVAMVRGETARRKWVGVDVERLTKMTLHPESWPIAVTAVPPGCKDRESEHYRVMYLEEMVKLVRRAGYGSPHENSAGVPRE